MLQVNRVLLRSEVELSFAAAVKFDGAISGFRLKPGRTTEQSTVLQNRRVVPSMYECMFNYVFGVEVKP